MRKILIVDDEPNVRLVYKEVLSEKGYEVLEAESSRETFDILNREPIDLLVLDIKLRSESGLDILQRVSKQFPQIPVVLCSAYISFQNDYTSWLADSYIVKSSDPEDLLKEIEKIIEKRGKGL
ncbi:MAG: two-component system response regulator [Deltaproteobacteria bacterium]|jgi:DNA-binding NtrC family response regulator|nr:MAG: two-component system response regulator [Deltaproteobacteria bacterium]